MTTAVCACAALTLRLVSGRSAYFVSWYIANACCLVREQASGGGIVTDDAPGVVASIVNASAFLVQPNAETLLQVQNMPMAVAKTTEHAFEVPGSPAYYMLAPQRPGVCTPA